MKAPGKVINKPYSPPLLQFNGHIQTIIPGLFRKIKVAGLERERWITPDDDFLDVDWHKTSSKKLVIICHGLEGDSRRPYVLGMIRALSENNFSTLSWNFRSCSGEVNKIKQFYHSGATDDLHFVIAQAIERFNPEEINLIGFSLGGNMTLKYLGENRPYNSLVKKAVAISVPIDLASSCKKMMDYENWIYEIRFLQSLKSKLKDKEKVMPGTFDLQPLKHIRHLWDFDDIYTGPVHGFTGAADYYEKCSAIHFLGGIRIPTLLLNARNDPFLSELCYPGVDEINNSKIIAYYPEMGGHCGFSTTGKSYLSEEAAIHFLTNE